MPTGYCLPGALSFACVLLVATVAPVSTRPLSDVTCEGGWTSLAGVCWMAVPSLIFTEGGELAQTFCRMQDSKLFFSDAAALCFKTGDSNYGSLSPMETAIRKRVMGNTGF